MEKCNGTNGDKNGTRKESVTPASSGTAEQAEKKGEIDNPGMV